MKTFWIAFSLAMMILGTAGAAPFPATSTSVLTAPEKGLYFSSKGFILKTEGTSWVPLRPSDSLLDTVKMGPSENSSASLSVRTDRIAADASLKLYTRKWMRDYPNYGFEVLATKNVSLNGHPALLVDMLSRSKGKQIRQVISKNEDLIAIMTCIDDRKSFTETLSQCNQIIKSFSWNTPKHSSPTLE